MPLHDPMTCGIDFVDSCDACRMLFIGDPERRDEIPTVRLLEWQMKLKQLGADNEASDLVNRLLTDRFRKRDQLLEMEANETAQRKRCEEWKRRNKR